MQKIEFEADISKDGNLRLPEQYQAWFGKHTKLILLIPDDQILTDKERGQKMADALGKIAAQGGTGITDPVDWQREIRRDRILLGRK